MNKKRYVVSIVAILVLAVLAYLQFRTWQHFDWAKLLLYRPRWGHIVRGVVFIYLTYFLRALRWKIFLRPERKNASILGLVAPTVIGFSGLALLGRPGEFIRPYLIARRESLSFASQLGVWTVERIFDVGAFAVLMAIDVFFSSAIRANPYLHKFRIAA